MKFQRAPAVAAGPGHCMRVQTGCVSSARPKGGSGCCYEKCCDVVVSGVKTHSSGGSASHLAVTSSFSPQLRVPFLIISISR